MNRILSITALLFLAATPVSAVTAATGATKVCMVGDSVIKRGGYWRNHMAQYIPFQYAGNYADDYTYLHDGVGGDTSKDVLDRIGTIPVCDITILHVGGNDLAKRERWPAAIASNVRLIADKLAERGSVVYVGTILPCNGCGTDVNLIIVATNELIKTALSGIHTVVDHWRAITKSGLPAWQLYVDAFHPSNTGYRVLADYDIAIIAP